MSRKIYQLLPSFKRGDAIGNEVVSIHRALTAMGLETHIYYLDDPKGDVDVSMASPYAQMPETTEEDIILYHLSIGSLLNRELRGMRGHKIFRYHNITPAEFFRSYNPMSCRKCRNGVEEIRALADVPERCIAVSEFNKEHLRSLGYTCEIDICPIVIDWTDYEQALQQVRSEGGAQEMASVGPNGDRSGAASGKSSGKPFEVLFVGRVAPNKKQQDLIAAIAAYAEQYDREIHLTLVGSWAGNEKYQEELRKYVDLLGLQQQVSFCGHLDFRGIVKAYTEADLFLCLSEHEGFCVPLVEAMHFGVPIIAYDAAAVGETLGDAGILLTDKTPEKVAEQIRRMQDPDQRERYRLAGLEREKLYASEVTTKHLTELLLR